MDLSTAAVKLAFLALPGLLAAQVYRKLRGRRPKESWETVFEVLLFSILSYSVWFFIVAACSYCCSKSIPPVAANQTMPQTRPASTVPNDAVSPLITALFDDKTPPPVLDLLLHVIAPSSFIGLLLAILASFIHSRKWLNRFARAVGASKRSGDEDGWDYFLNSPQIKWILVRDHKTNRAYYGFLRYFSESDKERELMLEKVKVVDNNTGTLLYYLESIYLGRDRDDITLEFTVSNADPAATKK